MTNSFGVYVSSCKNLVPPAYIDDNKCVRNCPTKGNIYLDEISDSNNPKCASNCSGNYIDSLTISGVKRCVSSCKNLEPTAYIYTDTENNDKLTCIRE